jgi:peptide chain release factor 1
MLDKVKLIEDRYEELNGLMADPEAAADHVKMTEYAQEQAEIAELVQAYRRYNALEKQLGESHELLELEEDAEIRELAEQEIVSLKEEMEALYGQMRLLLLPKDPRDEKNVIVEVRAGTGGDEAGLFAADLYRMYTRYAENQRWKTDILSFHDTGVGGYKEIIFEVKGRAAYSRLKYESGVHRVQRVPKTEASGRIHTSTATVAVLPEADEIDIKIDPKDLKIDAFGSSGPGGQNVNRNYTAIRITHKPSGLVVSCQDEKSQHRNKEKALRVLRARLMDIAQNEQQAEIAQNRRSQVGTGERSEKIRTYNFPQSRVTDHRLNMSFHNLEGILDGDLDDLLENLVLRSQAQALGESGKGPGSNQELGL